MHIQNKKNYDTIITNILHKSKPNEEANFIKDNINQMSISFQDQKRLFSTRLHHKQNKNELSNCSLRLNLTGKTSFYRPKLTSNLTKDIMDGLSFRLKKKNILKERRNMHLLEKYQMNYNSFVYDRKELDCDLTRVTKDLHDITIELNNQNNLKCRICRNVTNVDINTKSGNNNIVNQIRIKVKNKALAVY